MLSNFFIYLFIFVFNEFALEKKKNQNDSKDDFAKRPIFMHVFEPHLTWVPEIR